MSKDYKIANFRDKVTLMRTIVTTDKELNRIESIVPIKEVWAVVEVKSAGVDATPAGEKPVIKYTVTLRAQDIAFNYPELNYLKYKGKLLRLSAPWYSDVKYVTIEAFEVVP